MTRLILSYPDGTTGFALLVLRLTCALTAFPSIARLSSAQTSWWVPAIAAAILCLALVLGFVTRPAALLLLSSLTGNLLAVSGEVAFFVLASAGAVGALLLLGPGAHSVDAHRFGRRVIRLDPRSPDRGSAD